MTTGNAIFTEAQRELLTAVLNRIIPAQDKYPGAGDLGGAAYVERAAAGNVAMRRLLLQGLAQVEIAAGQRGGDGFPTLSGEEQDAALRQVESERPDFFRELVRQCYNSYYTNPEVFDLIGYSLPTPEDYQPLPFDESLLEPVRQRGQMWRPV